MKWKDKINKKYLQISLYVIITVMIIYSLSLVIKNAPTIFMFLLLVFNWVIKVIRPVIIGFIFAYLMDPVINFFERKYRRLKSVRFLKKIVAPRTWAAVTSVMILVIAVVGLISLLVFAVTNQLRLANFGDITKLGQELINSFSGFYDSVNQKLNDLNIESEEFDKYFASATTFVLNALKSFIENTLTSITNISSYMTTVIFSFLIGFYFMIDGRMFMSYIVKVSRALFSERTNKGIYNTIHDLDVVFSGYIRGQLTDALVMMLLISLVLTITGVKFSIVIGICAGIGNLIPYFGPIVAYIGTTLVCLINGDIKTLIVALIALFVIQAVDGNIIGPKLLSHSIQIHPLIIIISIIFGSAIGGFMGMLLAVPIGAYIKLVFVRFIDRRLEHKEEQKRLEATNSKKKQ